MNTTICTTGTTEFSRFMWCREVNLGREPQGIQGATFAGGERRETLGGGGENMGKAPLPKSSWRESGKLEIAAGTKLKREKGERRKETV